MANLAIEFHDAKLETVRRVGTDAVLVMRLYVHRSDGRPGREKGIGWYQDAEIRLHDAQLDDDFSTAATLMDGTVQVDDEVFQNVVDLPFDREGQVTLSLAGVGETFRARATRMCVVLLGDPGRIEDFSPGP